MSEPVLEMTPCFEYNLFGCNVTEDGGSGYHRNVASLYQSKWYVWQYSQVPFVKGLGGREGRKADQTCNVRIT
jgi:hypothetical protein